VSVTITLLALLMQSVLFHSNAKAAQVGLCNASKSAYDSVPVCNLH